MVANTWDKSSINALLDLPFFEVVSKAYAGHKQYFNPSEMEFCTLSSIKTGGCPEDCAYCPQSAHYQTGLKKEKLLDIDSVIAQAKMAKNNGAKRFCMGAAWKSPPKKDFPKVLDLVQAIKSLDLETCVTLGQLDATQAEQLKAAGLDFYNHNLDTSPEFYSSIITTRTYQDRLDTIKQVINADINVCCGGILGMGESREDRIQLLLELSRLPKVPQSIPINKLIPIAGTPLGNASPLDHFEFIKTIAVTRIMFPTSMIRLSAGREDMSEEFQAWCFMAGANSIFIGDTLLTAPNQSQKSDKALLAKLGMKAPVSSHSEKSC
jgi:biotin synthase